MAERIVAAVAPDDAVFARLGRLLRDQMHSDVRVHLLGRFFEARQSVVFLIPCL
jgi:hypothetical protein